MSDITILILAAGSSSRLGRSKQLVAHEGQSLLARTAAIACACTPLVTVVLGSNFELHQKEIAHLPARIVNHTDWQKGMGSSLKAGIRQILAAWPATAAIIVLVCDQPRLTGSHIQKLIQSSLVSEKHIISSCYRNTLGVPALFKKKMFKKLLRVDDAEGAKKIIQQNVEDVAAVNFEGGEIDIDTPDDLAHIA